MQTHRRGFQQPIGGSHKGKKKPDTDVIQSGSVQKLRLQFSGSKKTPPKQLSKDWDKMVDTLGAKSKSPTGSTKMPSVKGLRSKFEAQTSQPQEIPGSRPKMSKSNVTNLRQKFEKKSQASTVKKSPKTKVEVTQTQKSSQTGGTSLVGNTGSLEKLNKVIEKNVGDIVKNFSAQWSNMPEKANVNPALRALSLTCKDENALLELLNTNTEVKSELDKLGISDGKSIQLIATRAIRAHITKAYFQTTFIDTLLSNLEQKNIHLNPSDITSGMSGVGFNRLFSGTNDFGASLYSDVDFKIILDDSAQEGGAATQKGFTKDVAVVIHQSINEVLDGVSKGDFESMGITLEVDKFTVKRFSEIQSFANDPGRIGEMERNFYATMVNNYDQLFGDLSVTQNGLAPMRERFGKDESEGNVTQMQRIYTQYISQDTDKGSILLLDNFETVIQNLENLVQVARSQGEKEGVLQTDEKAEKLIHKFESHYGGKMIGKKTSNNEPITAENWEAAPGKFLFCRLYDTVQAFDAVGKGDVIPKDVRQKASVLNNIAIQFQNMLSTSLDSQTGASHWDTDSKYDTVTAEQFVNLYAPSTQYLENAIDPSGYQEMARDIKAKIDDLVEVAAQENLISPSQLSEIQKTLASDPRKGGGLFFMALAQSAKDVAVALNPERLVK